MKEKKNKPWPTKAAMTQVYEMKLWGGEEYDFYSGEGSHLSQLVEPYVNVLIEFLESKAKGLTVLDLGCGDFNVGNRLVGYTHRYIAVDIVENLIDRNKKLYSKKGLEFICLDIAKDNLPQADCVIIRQVLQHLSNREVQEVVTKLYNFKHVIVTEHIPTGGFIANQDIISGQGIRLKKKSGLVITKPPFNFKPRTEEELLSIKLNENKGVIKTVLYTL
ncbi:class I SAM-dependent methyltransferase [Pseudofulvibacter geojedonensis]|uniref:Class I SAM-dependent methyltransferase n=1 Tax=Pseudofulvibacter geojedonensis TaxID=1123758 RepID=A0ABW3HYP6_9FLAO